MKMVDVSGKKYLMLRMHRALLRKLSTGEGDDVFAVIPVGEDAELARDEPTGAVLSTEEAEKIAQMLGEFADYITHEDNPDYAPPGKARLFVIEKPPEYTVSCPFCRRKQIFAVGINERVFPSSCECGARVTAEIFGEDLHMTVMDILGEKYETRNHEGFTEYTAEKRSVRAVIVEEPEDPWEDHSYLLFVKER